MYNVQLYIHNTYIQILASCGIIGILTYIYHRIETIKLFFKTKNLSNILICITLIGFLLISLFDCHFHNMGPGFLYSALLILSEKVYFIPRNSTLPSQSKPTSSNCTRN